ncbi:MAG TPA: hypothetical protein VN676_17465 [Steroidobacteraceae bacterium]|nr:hypothetical protein [Steroidobacteraceae bacterium]
MRIAAPASDILDVCNVSVGATTNAAGNLDYTILFYGIAGAASSPQDTVVGGGGDGGNPGSLAVAFKGAP